MLYYNYNREPTKPYSNYLGPYITLPFRLLWSDPTHQSTAFAEARGCSKFLDLRLQVVRTLSSPNPLIIPDPDMSSSAGLHSTYLYIMSVLLPNPSLAFRGLRRHIRKKVWRRSHLLSWSMCQGYGFQHATIMEQVLSQRLTYSRGAL